MTTTTRRPPAKAPRKRARDRPADAAAPAPAVPAERAPAKRPSAPRASGAATKTAPAKTAPAKPKAAKATATKTAPAKTKAAKSTAKSTAKRPAARSAPPRTPFVLLIVGLLGGALVSLLLLNTVLAKDAFTLTRLQQSNKRLEQQRQAYEGDIARGNSPAQLSKMAEALNMKQAEDPAFFYPGTGRAGGGTIRPVPHQDAAAAGAAGVIGVPGTVVPGDGVPPAAAGTGSG